MILGLGFADLLLVGVDDQQQVKFGEHELQKLNVDAPQLQVDQTFRRVHRCFTDSLVANVDQQQQLVQLRAFRDEQNFVNVQLLQRERVDLNLDFQQNQVKAFVFAKHFHELVLSELLDQEHWLPQRIVLEIG